jgi:hypothetical protein
MTNESTRILSELRELIAALDRRIPQIQRAGEAAIAQEAAALKMKAQERIAKLERESSALM